MYEFTLLRKDSNLKNLETLPTVCTTSATTAVKLKIVASKLARWHVSTQSTLTREHAGT